VALRGVMLSMGCMCRYAEFGARFGDLYAACLRESGTLCLAIWRLLEEEGDGEDEVFDESVGFLIFFYAGNKFFFAAVLTFYCTYRCIFLQRHTCTRFYSSFFTFF
jgi:hypothetical protein